ncbi:MAG: class I SAM-dependent methyltransferase, partial [Fibrobacteres bacterium]|nr:class I SAM-dependent methyltransferase [Fibrobacterota bacterium]
EIGGGDCKVSIAVAALVQNSIGIDVVDLLVPSDKLPLNFRFVKSNGLVIPLESAVADFVYCNQLLEHLHPDDAEDLVKDVFRVLKPGGTFLCITPNRLYGPHDVSRYFDKKATGFHLKEYTVGEAYKLIAKVGFQNVKLVYNTKKRFLLISAAFGRCIELIACLMTVKFRKKILTPLRIRCLLGFKMVAYKQSFN